MIDKRRVSAIIQMNLESEDGMQELDKMVEEICENAFFMDDDLVKEKNRDENKLYISFSKLKKIIFSYLMHDDGWIPVEERLPEKNEYFVETSSDKDFPNGYYKRLEIAYMTDTIEYVHGYYDGYKWMDKYLDTIKNIVAWRIHEPYQPKTPTQRPEWKDRMLHTFLGGHEKGDNRVNV